MVINTNDYVVGIDLPELIRLKRKLPRFANRDTDWKGLICLN